MEINVLATGSSGNCYLIGDGSTTLMFEAGITVKKANSLSNFKAQSVDGVFISHEHIDHTQGLYGWLSLDLPVYLSKENYEGYINRTKIKLTPRELENIHFIEHQKMVNIGTFEVYPLEMVHDVHCLGFLIKSKQTNQKLLFATDTADIPYILSDIDILMVEANYGVKYLEESLKKGEIHPSRAARTKKTHMDISRLEWLLLNHFDLSKTKLIYLLHLSSANSNGIEFKDRIAKITGKEIIVPKTKK